MENTCRLSIAATGAFLHPLGEQVPIDCRHGETIPTVRLPHRALLFVTDETLIPYGDLKDPRAVIIWNMSGVGLQTQPDEREAAAIAAKVLEIGLTDDTGLSVTGWLAIPPARPGRSQGGSQILWLSPGTRVAVRAANSQAAVCARVLVIPGPEPGSKSGEGTR